MWNLYWTWHIISRFMGCKLFPKGWKICAVWKLNSRFWILITWFDGADKGDGAVLRLDLWINTCDDSHLRDCIRTIHQLRMCVIWCALLVQCVCVCLRRPCTNIWSSAWSKWVIEELLKIFFFWSAVSAFLLGFTLAELFSSTVEFTIKGSKLYYAAVVLVLWYLLDKIEPGFHCWLITKNHKLLWSVFTSRCCQLSFNGQNFSDFFFFSFRGVVLPYFTPSSDKAHWHTNRTGSKVLPDFHTPGVNFNLTHFSTLWAAVRAPYLTRFISKAPHVAGKLQPGRSEKCHWSIF